jgi:hypothetical protein
MAPTGLRIKLPERCPSCGLTTSVAPDVAMESDSIVLTWTCSACHRRWPITPDAVIPTERRRGDGDRRRSSEGQKVTTIFPDSRAIQRG